MKRGYVSHTHIEGASSHNPFAHPAGKLYRRLDVQRVALPLDMLTSTPDYAPFTFAPQATRYMTGAR